MSEVTNQLGAEPAGRTATTDDEQRVFIPCGDSVLSAVLTRPIVPANGGVVVFYAGRWSITSIGRSRLFVHLARDLAGLGFHSVRVDLLGLGESTGEESEWNLEELFQDEPAAIRRWLVDQGLTDIWVAGTCGGARLALDSAKDDENVVGAVLMSPPVRNYRKGDRTATLPGREFVKRALTRKVLASLTDPRARRRYRHHLKGKLARIGIGGSRPSSSNGRGFEWVSANLLDALESLARRGVPVLFFFGEDDAAYDDFTRGRSGRLGRILDKAGDRVSVAVVPGRFHGLSQTDLHRLAREAMLAWAPLRRAAAPAEESAG